MRRFVSPWAAKTLQTAGTKATGGVLVCPGFSGVLRHGGPHNLGERLIHSEPPDSTLKESEPLPNSQFQFSFTLEESVPHSSNEKRDSHRNVKLWFTQTPGDVNQIESNSKPVSVSSSSNSDSKKLDSNSDSKTESSNSDSKTDQSSNSDSKTDQSSNSDSKTESSDSNDNKADSKTETKKASEEEDKKKVEQGPRFKDLGGMKNVLGQLEDVISALRFPKLAKLLGGKPVSGMLLHGPPGCGKTKLAQAIANETGFSFFSVSSTSLLNRYFGESEKNIRKLFFKAHKKAPSIVFIDEIDAICGKRENNTWYATELAQLLTCMDGSEKLKPEDYDSDSDDDDDDDKNKDKDAKSGSDQDEVSRHVLVIAATNRPDALDPALRRPGRFDIEIFFNVPDENDRVEILKVVTSNLRLEGPLDLADIARSTSGYVGADLTALASRACAIARKRILQERHPNISIVSTNGEEYNEDWVELEKEKLNITVADFEKAIQEVQPSLKREGFSAIPKVKWEDVGGLEALRKELDLHIVSRIKYPDIYEKFGMNLETGFLLYGPPGCGKTLIAKAVANEAGANFIHIKGPELMDSHWGESERLVRELFNRARTCTPCILFFDEVDAITAKRGKEGQEHVERLLNQLLVELDGGDQRKGVIVIGATNRPDVLDPAVLRPGRFGKHVHIPLPNKDERDFILKALARNKPVDASVDLAEIAQRSACDNFSGADLAALLTEATMAAVQEQLLLAAEKGSSESADVSPCTIKEAHFEQALSKMKPSISDEDLQDYQEFGKPGVGRTKLGF